MGMMEDQIDARVKTIFNIVDRYSIVRMNEDENILYITLPEGHDVTLAELQALAEFLGTSNINLTQQYQQPDYSERTPGSFYGGQITCSEVVWPALD